MAQAGKNSKFKDILNSAAKAFKYLHTKGDYAPEDLLEVDEYKDLLQKMHGLFSSTISQEVSSTLRAYLDNDVFVFSGLRSHAQLSDARSYLKDEKGNIRPYNEFSQKMLKLNAQYNENYLQTEYEFAIQSGLSAEKWETFSDDSKRYYLQYRTAKDDKVRASHASLDETTLPKDDAFWKNYMPPNGWNCRCNTVEVSADNYMQSDSEKAIKAGEKATTQIGKSGKNKFEMFRFNPGAENRVFPKGNAYEKVKGASELKKNLKKFLDEKEAFVPDKISEYENELDIKINKEIFKHLNKDTPLTFSNPKGMSGSGAYYLPSSNIVRIPIDARRRNSKWKAESVVYHEYGHAADWQRNLKGRKEVLDLMEKYRKILNFPEIDKRLEKLGYWSAKKNKIDLMEKVGAAHDTLMSLNPKYGMGHSQEYWKREGNKEAEFIAHAFENAYSKNEVFKKVMPDLYKESIELIEKFKLK